MILHGDCLERLKELADNSVDSVVTDPPYGWSFMGKAWDNFDIEKRRKAESNRPPRKDGKSRGRGDPSLCAGTYDISATGNWNFMIWTQEWATEIMRVLKPGGHMLVFCGPRTYHAMAMGLEQAGFEIRDQLQWLFGSGFPKSQDVSKAIDKQAGAKREVIGYNPKWNSKPRAMAPGEAARSAVPAYTAPATDAAKQWQGWGTALKPANEPICLARKPLEAKLTVAANVLKHGTGALNIDASRIGFQSEADRKAAAVHDAGSSGNTALNWNSGEKKESGKEYRLSEGRWPSNCLLDEEAAAALDEQSGQLSQCGGPKKTTHDAGMFGIETPGRIYKEENRGASRFFYVAKSSKRDRNSDGAVNNVHPTCKPTKLMEYLVRMVTPPGGVVLDPFMGSGTTGVAAKRLGFKFIGIEMSAEYLQIAKRRIASA